MEQVDTAEPEHLYTADEIAATLRVSRSTIHRRIAAGEIGAFRVGREYRIRASARRAYFERIGFTGRESAEPAPQDLTAEQSVLGGMMLSEAAIGEVTETMNAADFYRPAHTVIYQVILDLYGGGEPTDPVAVSAELDRRGELRRAGGAPYLHTLVATVPTAANAAYYAGIVAEKAQLRRLVQAGEIAEVLDQGGDAA